MNIREANIKDKEFILNGHQEIMNKSNIKLPSALNFNFEEDFLINKKANCYVIEEDKERLGYFIFSTIYFADTGLGAYVSNIYLSENARSKGLFKVVLDFVTANYDFATFLVHPEDKVMNHVMEKYGCICEDLYAYTYDKKHH